jgi:hypothetical protein
MTNNLVGTFNRAKGGSEDWLKTAKMTNCDDAHNING